MKPELEKIQDLQRGTFIAKRVVRDNRPLLSQAWHYHPEIEICYTRKSSGNRYVGNNISDYQEGDLVMIGSLIPHGFTTIDQSEQIVVQFNHDFLGAEFMNKTELRKVNELFLLSKSGLQFGGSTYKDAIEVIEDMLDADGFNKLLKLFQLLNLLSLSQEYSVICSKEYTNSINIDQLTRMKKVFDYIELNFKKDITVRDAANLINLTESAFYKFVKKHTKKKFTQILNEFRINHASRLIIEEELTIAEICFECGYNNLSYFNRKFKEMMGESPRVFRNRYK